MFDRFLKPAWQQDVENFAAEDAKKSAEACAVMQDEVWCRVSSKTGDTDTAPTEERCMQFFQEMVEQNQKMPSALLTQLWYSHRFPSIGIKKEKRGVRLNADIEKSFQKEQTAYEEFMEQYGDEKAKEMCKRNMQWNTFAFDKAGVEGMDCVIDPDILRLIDPQKVLDTERKVRSFKIQDTIRKASRLNVLLQTMEGHIDAKTADHFFQVLTKLQQEIMAVYGTATPSIPAIVHMNKEECIQRYAQSPNQNAA